MLLTACGEHIRHLVLEVMCPLILSLWHNGTAGNHTFARGSWAVATIQQSKHGRLGEGLATHLSWESGGDAVMGTIDLIPHDPQRRPYYPCLPGAEFWSR